MSIISGEIDLCSFYKGEKLHAFHFWSDSFKNFVDTENWPDVFICNAWINHSLRVPVFWGYKRTSESIQLGPLRFTRSPENRNHGRMSFRPVQQSYCCTFSVAPLYTTASPCLASSLHPCNTARTTFKAGLQHKKYPLYPKVVATSFLYLCHLVSGTTQTQNILFHHSEYASIRFQMMDILQ